ncbi:Arm repeat superfamily protein [Thalictrum thalictroides]|uniref:Arm repeat superfamily protein n=1 Tax=Thalictrum thalictroides TaxID=46969 RepID=A0A7J6XEN7_THATH|nr:Arm repeat superfamily protein [Thalictrum thalictroides]
MEDTILRGLVVPKHILQHLLDYAKCSTLDDALESLIKIARTESGRSELASKNVLVVLELIRFLLNHLTRSFLLSSLKLLRNLCAGELRNQNSFITNNGVEVISCALNSGNEKFVTLLCMVIYICCIGSNERIEELCGAQGIRIVEDISKTASIVGFGEDWLKWLLSEVCFEEHKFPALFYQLSLCDVVTDDLWCKNLTFSEEQAFMMGYLGILSKILNQHLDEVSVSNEFSMCVLGILKKASGSVDFFSTGKSALPTGISEVDVLGYSLTILRDVCAKYDPRSSNNEGSIDVVDSILSSGLLELLLDILCDLGPPEIIRK